MSKQYGLIVPNKDKPTKPPLVRPSIFDDDSSDDSDTANKPTGLQHSVKQQHKITQNKAIEQDPTVFQYDELYDEMDKQRKESKLSRKDLDRKPKYINRLLVAADRRKRENERRIERQVQKERDAEGEEFRDKEEFVTSAYKKKLEEMRELEAQEKREDYLESIGDVRKQGNLDGFYRHLYEQKLGSDKEVKPVKNFRKRKNSSDGEAADAKKEHLPSNLDADSDFSIDSSDEDAEAPEKQAEPPKIEPKNEKEPTPPPASPPKPKIDIWKKRTVGPIFDAALQRYFERKSQRQL